MIDILRLSADTNLITAQVFESLFNRHIGSAVRIARAPLGSWMTALLGPPENPVPVPEAARRLCAATSGHDFISLDYRGAALAPLIAAVRNRARAPVRLLFIAHAAGVYLMEWTLMRGLLCPGDVIVAPSESARRTIALLCPELEFALRMIPHPISPPVGRPVPRRRDVVYLGRVHADKLLHRGIEALHLLKLRRGCPPRLRIAGALDDGVSAGPSTYARALMAKVQRLGLSDVVEFTGPVRGDAAKHAFLQGARVLLNLSVTLEESCPKTPVEALGVGLPVVGTQWNGIRDVVGACGALVPVTFVGSGVGAPDVDEEALAEAIEQMIEHPTPADACRAQAATFSPSTVVPRYLAMLNEARDAAHGERVTMPEPPPPDVAASPASGLLHLAAPLRHLSWRACFDAYRSSCPPLRASWERRRLAPPTDGDRLRWIMQGSLQAPLERAFAGLPLDIPLQPEREHIAVCDSVDDAIAAELQSSGLLSARLACAAELLGRGRVDEVEAALHPIERRMTESPGVAYLGVELALRLRKTDLALRRVLRSLMAFPVTEGEASRLRQAARTARRAGEPERVLAWLDAWLARYPDSLDSGSVWLEWCVNGARAPRAVTRDLATGLAKARALLGDVPAVRKAARLVEATNATQLFA